MKYKHIIVYYTKKHLELSKIYDRIFQQFPLQIDRYIILSLIIKY